MFRTPLQRAAGLVGLGVVIALLVFIVRSDPPGDLASPPRASAAEPGTARTPAPDALPHARGTDDVPRDAPVHAVVSSPAPQALPPVGPSEVDVGHDEDGARTLRGVVLDARGAPAEGAHVHLRRLVSDAVGEAADPAAAFDAMTGWEATADADGAFVFQRVPPYHMALGARGRDGDQASLFVDAAWNVSFDVTLVLEATATIRVDSPRFAGGSVRFHPVEARALGSSGAFDPSPEVADDPGAAVAVAGSGAEDEARMPSQDAMMKAVVEAVETPLLEWDPDAPDASLVRIAEGALTALPAPLLDGFDAELRRELELPEGTSRRVLIEAAVAKALEEEPAIAHIVGLVAARFAKSPERGLLALVEDAEFQEEMRQAIEAEEAARRAAEPDIHFPAEYEDQEVLASEPVLVEPSAFEPEPAPSDVERARLVERFPELSGLFRYRSWCGHEEATGRVGEALTVRAGYTYDIIVEIGAEYWELECGRVFVGAGEDLVVGCGPGSVVLTGRLVDAAGRPAPGTAFIEASAEGVAGGTLPACDAEVAANGTFRCMFQVGAATTARIELRRDLAEAVASVSRRGVTLVPGAVVDLGTLVLRGYQGDEPVQFDGAELVDTDDGVVFAAVDPGAPAAALGLQTGDALVRIGGVEAGRLPAADLFDGLAGGPEGLDVDPGDDVLIRDARGATFSIPLGALMSALGGL